MKRSLILFVLILAAIIGTAQNVSLLSMKTVNEQNYSTDYTLTNNVSRCFTIWVPRNNATYQTFTANLQKVSGLTAVKVAVYGSYTLHGDSTQIGSDTDWNCTSDTDETVEKVNITPNLYQYFIVKYTGTGTGSVKVVNQNMKVWQGNLATTSLITGTAGATITGAAVNLNASSNYAVNVGTGSTNAAISIGGGSNTVVVNSSVWDISAAGAASGITTIAASGKITSASYNFCTAGEIGGTGDAITVTKTELATLAAGIELTFIAEAANTTTVTLAVNGVSKAVYEEVGATPNALEANDIRSGMVVKVVYDGTQWVMISPSGN